MCYSATVESDKVVFSTLIGDSVNYNYSALDFLLNESNNWRSLYVKLDNSIERISVNGTEVLPDATSRNVDINLKTVKNQSLLGSGNIAIDDDAFTATYGVTTYDELLAAVNDSRQIVIDDSSSSGGTRYSVV